MDANGRYYAFYRKRYCEDGLYEEVWQHKNKKWHHVPLRIIWIQISGECSFTQVNIQQVRRLIPEAFNSNGLKP